MEFNEKLQQLRTGKNLTQEQLAEQLYVSRTAISKWESGKGYPNIESLKCISKFFSVTIDELLSGEELITLAETENRSNLKKIYSFIYGILDMMAVTFILLPLYGNLVDGYIYSVNLLSFTDTTPIYLAIYWIVFIVLIALGIAKLMCVCFEKESWSNIITKYRSKVLAIFDQIPGLLSRHEKRVVFNKIVEGSMADQYEETFFWLSDSMIANECRRVSDPNVGLSLTESDTYIKCYLGDTGLLVSHAFDENELLEDEVYKQIFAGKLGLNEGMLYENVIAQMMVSNGHRLFFYTQYNAEKRRNDIEIDFIIANNSKTKYKMYPIEVKSSAKYSFESLKRFKEKYKSRIGGCYIIHPRNLIEKDDILCVPPYMTICL